jgi:hypothetical protein
MSPAWIATARRVITDALAGEDLAGPRLVLCEEFTDPPAHLRRAGAPTVGFTVAVGGGRVEVGDDPSVAADLRVVSPYADALAVARDPDAAAADPAEAARRVAEGRLRVEGDPAALPPALTRVDLHRLLAAHTR